MCYFCHAQLFEITYAENIKSPFEQHSCQNAKVVEVLCDAGCRLSTRCRPSIHRPPVDALRVPAEMPIALSWAPLHADIHVVRCCGRAHHREQRRHAIPIALAASQYPTARDFVPWRFLVAGRFSAWSVSSSRRPKTCTTADLDGSAAIIYGDDPGRRDRVADQVRLQPAAHRARAALSSSRTASKTRARARPAGTSLPPHACRRAGSSARARAASLP